MEGELESFASLMAFATSFIPAITTFTEISATLFPSRDRANPSIPMEPQACWPTTFLASANACTPYGSTTGSTINGVGCMPVLSNSQAGYPKGLKKYPHYRFMPRFGFAYRPFDNDKTAIRGGFGMYNITVLGSNFLFSDRHSAGADNPIHQHAGHDHARDWLPVAADLRGRGQCRLLHLLRAGLFRYGEQRELEGSLYGAMVFKRGSFDRLRIYDAALLYRLGNASTGMGSG